MKTYDKCVGKEKLDALKKLYYLQLERKGEVGYSTGQVKSKKKIQPLKRRKLLNQLQYQYQHLTTLHLVVVVLSLNSVSETCNPCSKNLSRLSGLIYQP